METRRSFVKKAALTGIAGILASGRAPVYAKNMKMLKIGLLGKGSHGFAARFKNPPENYQKKILAKPYGVWDDYPGLAEFMKGDTYEKVFKDPVKLAHECDCIHIEHADYRKILELAQPGIEEGKPTFINRPFAAKIGDAEEIVRLARRYDAPLMCASSLEFGAEISEIQAFMKEKGPIRAYAAFGPEAHFTWHFPHVINYAHAAIGGGIDTAYFTGHFGIDMRKWRLEGQKIGASLCVLNYKPRNGEPPIVGMCHIGNHKGQFHIDIYAVEENRDFVLKGNWGDNMFDKLNELYSFRKIPRPYEAILEQHRTLVAANVSRLKGAPVSLDSLGGADALPYSDAIRRYAIRGFIEKQKKGS